MAGDAPTEFSPVEPAPLPWPRLRRLRADGRGRFLLRRSLLTRGPERTAASRDLFFRLAGQFTPSLAVDAEGIRFHLNTSDKEISRIVFIYGLYDRPLMHAAFAALSALGGARDFGQRRLLDIGANIGTTTLTACGHFGASGSYAFEPDPVNARFLRLNVAANGLQRSVEVHEAAVSDRAATLRLGLSATNAGDHQILTGDDDRGETVEVDAVRIDDLVASGAVDIDALGAAWLDVQGHEGHALAGATSLLESDVPIVLEFWPEGLRRTGGLDLLESSLGAHRSHVVDLGGPQGTPDFAPKPVGDLPRIASRYAGEDEHTDLLVLPRTLPGLR